MPSHILSLSLSQQEMICNSYVSTTGIHIHNYFSRPLSLALSRFFFKPLSAFKQANDIDASSIHSQLPS